ncbi:MAG: hypothetical protein JWO76_1718 [Nocardioides sp.]|nr:hypothetical protein [Nocardioides sp.]
MTDDDLMEAGLRSALRTNETALEPRLDLAGVAVELGRRRIRRRRRWAAAGGAAAVVVVVAAGVVGPRLVISSDPTGGSPMTDSEHPDPTSAVPVLPGVWAQSLPVGEAPDVPYLSGTTLHLPGTTVELDATGAGLVGDTVAGAVLLLEHETRRPYSFTSEYVVVSDSGAVTPLGTGHVAHVQEELVSPDGTMFASDAGVVSMESGSVVAALPAGATALDAWTSAGILYLGPRGHYYLWSPERGRGPAPVEGFPGSYAEGSDVGLRRDGGCTEVVRLGDDAGVEVLHRLCDMPDALTVSPTGDWVLTMDLQIVDARTGEVRPLGDAPLEVHVSNDAYWEAEDELLVSVPLAAPAVIDEHGVRTRRESALLVRCGVVTGSCERVTDALDVPGPQPTVQLP